ncbi:MAG TPA: hypothetical protein VHU41_06450, partial [Thermoanaerobaculia bacterium]|nr:hypothetical protein [Thermoanaerobaculia bacterium]
MKRRFWLEAATLVIAAVLCALVSNALAGRERKVALKGDYPNALKVPQETTTAPAPVLSGAPAASPAPVVSTNGGEGAAAPLKP